MDGFWAVEEANKYEELCCITSFCTAVARRTHRHHRQYVLPPTMPINDAPPHPPCRRPMLRISELARRCRCTLRCRVTRVLRSREMACSVGVCIKLEELPGTYAALLAPPHLAHRSIRQLIVQGLTTATCDSEGPKRPERRVLAATQAWGDDVAARDEEARNPSEQVSTRRRPRLARGPSVAID